MLEIVQTWFEDVVVNDDVVLVPELMVGIVVYSPLNAVPPSALTPFFTVYVAAVSMFGVESTMMEPTDDGRV